MLLTNHVATNRADLRERTKTMHSHGDRRGKIADFGDSYEIIKWLYLHSKCGIKTKNPVWMASLTLIFTRSVELKCQLTSWRSLSKKPRTCVFNILNFTQNEFSLENYCTDCNAIAKVVNDLVEVIMSLKIVTVCSYEWRKPEHKHKSLWNGDTRQDRQPSKHPREHHCWPTGVVTSGCNIVDRNS